MYPTPANESDRLSQLWQYRVVGTSPELQFDHLATLASTLFDAPMVAISFVDAERLWLKARVGLDVCEAPRDIGFCTHAIMQDELLVVPDMLEDARFSANPLVLNAPGIRFYAGAPLIVAGGYPIGALCIMDTKPRPDLSPDARAQLGLLASLVVGQLELRRLDYTNAATRGFADSTFDAMLCIDGNGVLTFVNTAALNLFGYAADEMIGHTLDLIMPERFRQSHAAGVARIAAGGVSKLVGKTVEIAALRRSGEEFPIELNLCSWHDRHGPAVGAIIRDISERKQRDLRLHRLAHQDPLTGLANRLQAEQALTESLSAGEPSTVLLVDLDGFKSVNDGLGHTAGDALLQALAVRLNAALEPGALLARMGGDEFAIILPGSGDLIRAATCAQAMVSCAETPFRVLGHDLHVGISIGVAIGPQDGADAEEVVASADLALHRAKADGKRRFRLFEPAMRNTSAANRALQDELRRAVGNRELVLYYQPQVHLGTGQVFGAEALVRWRHPTRGLLLPGAFIPVLETHALAAEVGNWVLDEACRQAAQWRDAGLPRLRMSVNLFAAQLRNNSLSPALVETLNRHGFAPADLELEITETIALQNDERVFDALHHVRKLGVGLAFDDFGTGHASLSTLKRVPITTLKIDRSFVRDLLGDNHDAAVVEAVVGVGRRLGLNVVAEGIETPEQEACVTGLGCLSGQGYWYGRPMPAEAFRLHCYGPDSLDRPAPLSAA